MSEPGLVERLRAMGTPSTREAADRIVALEAERDEFIKRWNYEIACIFTAGDLRHALQPAPTTITASDPDIQEIRDEMQSGERLPGWVTGKTP